MYYDYHIHCDFSADSKTSMIDMVEKSVDLVLKEICFTDHVYYDIIGNPNVKIDYTKYFNALEYYANKYKDRLSIKKE